MSEQPDLDALKIPRGPRVYGAPARSRWPGRLGALAVFGVLAYLAREPLAEAYAARTAPEVEVVVVTSAPARAPEPEGMAANGHVVAARRAALSADSPGRIVELNVTEGARVEAGAVVARLYSDEFEAAVARAEADEAAAAAEVARAELAVADVAAEVRRLRAGVPAVAAEVRAREAELALANLEVARAEKLARRGAGQQRDLDRTRSDVRRLAALKDQAAARRGEIAAAVARAEAQRELAASQVPVAAARARQAAAATRQARAALEKLEVRAPFAGVVVLKDAEVGEVVSPNVTGGASSRGAIVTMVDFESLEVQVEVPETSLSAVRPGGPVRVYLDADPSRALPGTVSRIWPTANRQKATVEVRIRLADRPADLRPDMGVRAVFVADAAPPPAREVPAGPRIPARCLAVRAGVRGAFVLEGTRAVFRPLTLGEFVAETVSVREGLADGDRVVAVPPLDLESGDRVRIKRGG